MISKLKYIIPIALVLGTLSCRKEFLDINADPNNPIDAPVSLLLTGAERALGDALAMGGGNNGGLSQILEVYVHQITTREDADQYGTIGNDFFLNVAWPKLYAATPPPGESAPLSGVFQNLEEIISKSNKDGNPYYRGISKILKAYAYSQLVDVFGDVPYSEANKLADSIAPIIYPKFDDDAAIYPQLFILLDEAVADLSKLKGDNLEVPKDNDVIFKGDVEKWIKTANTIKLKLYTQVRNVQNVQPEVTALLSDPAALIDNNEESFFLPYGANGATDDRNPAFQEYFATQRSNHISPWFYETMKGRNAGVLNGNPDPRIPYYWYNQLFPLSPPPYNSASLASDSLGEGPENQTEYRDGPFATIYFGSVGADRDRNNQNSLSVIGIYPCGGRYDDGEGMGNIPTTGVDGSSGTGKAPYRFLTYADRLYLEAELMNVGLATGNEKTVFEKAVRESFKQVDQVVNLVGSSQTIPSLLKDSIGTLTETYITKLLTEYDAGNTTKKLRLIMTEKWISSFGSAVDAYTDYRRTGFPVMWDPNDPSMAPGGFAQPPVNGDLYRKPQRPVPVLLTKAYPLSLPWPKTELDVNKNAPAQKADPATAKVFWMP